MTTLIQFLEEIEQSRQTVVIPAEEVACLVGRFGTPVRSMGFWNKTGDGSIEIPMANVVAAVRELGGDLASAVAQLKSSEALERAVTSSAQRLIETLSDLYLHRFESRVERFQNANDPAEAERLWAGISRDLFGE